jgi:hypothetical protein
MRMMHETHMCCMHVYRLEVVLTGLWELQVKLAKRRKV